MESMAYHRRVTSYQRRNKISGIKFGSRLPLKLFLYGLLFSRKKELKVGTVLFSIMETEIIMIEKKIIYFLRKFEKSVNSNNFGLTRFYRFAINTPYG